MKPRKPTAAQDRCSTCSGTGQIVLRNMTSKCCPVCQGSKQKPTAAQKRMEMALRRAFQAGINFSGGGWDDV